MTGELIQKQTAMMEVQAEEIRFNSMLKMSERLSKSGLIPSNLRGKPDDLLVIIMMARELNIPPMQAMSGISVIQGKPTAGPQLMLALIRSRIPKSFVKIEEGIENGELGCRCTMGRDYDRPNEHYSSLWTIRRAAKMQLTEKDNWKKQPATMLKWRAVGDAARSIFPDVIMGLYIPEEIDPNLIVNEDGEIIHTQSRPEIRPATVIPPKVVEHIPSPFKEIHEEKAQELTPFDIIEGHYKALTKNYADKEMLDRLKETFGDSKQLRGMSRKEQFEIIERIKDYEQE